MSEAAKKEYAESIKTRYRRGNREEEGLILQEFCAVTGYHRKSALGMPRRRIRELARRTPSPREFELGRANTERIRSSWQPFKPSGV